MQPFPRARCAPGSGPRCPGSPLILLLAACVEEAPLPKLGDCAIYPEGTYTYGQIGIGTCLAGPADMRWVGEGSVLAISNANPWWDFTGGSLLTLDADDIVLGGTVNVLSDLDPHAMDLPSFAGALDVVPDWNLVIVAERNSEDARTREAVDTVRFIDVSDPTDPRGADVTADGDLLDIGLDPSAILYDDASALAFVVQRTSHEVSIIDMSGDPFERVSPTGAGDVDGESFTDADASGSRAEFVTLSAIPAAFPDAHSWDLQWANAAVRMWLPAEGGAYRMTGNGESAWSRSALDLDLDVEETGGAVLAVEDPSFLLESSEVARVVFLDQGDVRAADAPAWIGNWAFEAGALLRGGQGGWDDVLGGPHLVQSAGGWYLFYDGGDGVTQSIGVATSSDGVSFSPSDTPLLVDEAASLEDPYVVYDEQIDRWRMWFSVRSADGTVTVGEARSADLVEWTRAATAVETGEKPVLGYHNGRWHLYTQVDTSTGWEVQVQTSVDGATFDLPVSAFLIEGEATDAPGMAIQTTNEGAFRLTDDAGGVFPLSLSPGDQIDSGNDGWRVRIAAGFVLGTDEAGDLANGGVALGSILADTAYVTAQGYDGLSRIVAAERVDDDLFLDTVPLLEPGAGGDFDDDAVSDPVVVEIGGELVLYYAGQNHGVTQIGRATSSDGLVWEADADPVIAGSASFESVEMRPGSVQVRDDGTVRLWYTASDGDRNRIGAADSTDGGVSFTRIAGTESDWQFDGGAPGDWDDSGVRHPWVVTEGGTDHLWFSGFDGNNWQLGYATRVSGGEWEESTDADDLPRPILEVRTGDFGVGGLGHPVVLGGPGAWEIWYTGEDSGIGRIGRSVAVDPDRPWRDLRMPTIADTWGFTSEPDADLTAIPLDGTYDGTTLLATGCAALAADVPRGFVYVGCKLLPMIFVLDVRDDSTESFSDLNYLAVESVLYAGTSTNGDSGYRSLRLDETRGVLHAISDDPEALYTIRVDDVVDDTDSEFLRDRILGMVPLPRGLERDRGTDTRSSVGPAGMAMHPDGRHAFVTNFNDNSVSCIDLDLGPGGTLIAQADNVGENPAAILLTPDGARAIVANYAGSSAGEETGSSLVVIDTDPASASFMEAVGWVVNQ